MIEWTLARPTPWRLGVLRTRSIGWRDLRRRDPARLAGTDAWAAWGLTGHADPQRLKLAIPARYPDSYVKALVARIVEGLARPLWPETDPPPIHVHDRTVRSLQDGEPVTIEILDLPWYRPRSERRPAGEAVTLDRWPIIDETAATRQRLEAITPHGVTSRDVNDIARWTQLKTAQTDAADTDREPPRPTTSRRARSDRWPRCGHRPCPHHLPTTQRGGSDTICEAFQTLTNELARIPARRDRFEMARR